MFKRQRDAPTRFEGFGSGSPAGRTLTWDRSLRRMNQHTHHHLPTHLCRLCKRFRCFFVGLMDDKAEPASELEDSFILLHRRLDFGLLRVQTMHILCSTCRSCTWSGFGCWSSLLCLVGDLVYSLFVLWMNPFPGDMFYVFPISNQQVQVTAKLAELAPLERLDVDPTP